MKKDKLKLKVAYWRRRARSAEAERDRIKAEAARRITELSGQLQRAQSQAYAGDMARQELSDREAQRRGEQGIFG